MSLADEVRARLRALPAPGSQEEREQDYSLSTPETPVTPRPETARPQCPRWVGPAGRRIWMELIPELERLGVLTRMDRHALARYCRLAVEWEELTRRIEDVGHVQEYESGAKAPSAEASARAKLGISLLQLERELGLTPAARAKMLYASYGGRPLARPGPAGPRAPAGSRGRRGAYRKRPGGEAS